MTSVERIVSYTKLQQEESDIRMVPPPLHWPKYGKIKFENVSMHYDDCSNTVLDNLTFCIEANEKVGFGEYSITFAILLFCSVKCHSM